MYLHCVTEMFCLKLVFEFGFRNVTTRIFVSISNIPTVSLLISQYRVHITPEGFGNEPYFSVKAFRPH